jgi:hypothetical protein
MYRCHACFAVVGPRITRRLHVVHRTVREPWKDPRQEIAREYPVCRRCQELLVIGIPLTTIRQKAQNNQSPVVVKAVLPAAPSVQDTPVLFGYHRVAAGTVPPVSAAWWMPPVTNGPALTPSPPRAVCDLCGKSFTDGQSTADAVICKKCLTKGE